MTRNYIDTTLSYSSICRIKIKKNSKVVAPSGQWGVQFMDRPQMPSQFSTLPVGSVIV